MARWSNPAPWSPPAPWSHRASACKRGELWAGSPAKLMRTLSEKEMQYFSYSAKHYVELAQSYR